MLTFFGTIFIVYFIWLVVKPLVAKYMRRKFQQKVNDMFNQAYGGGARSQSGGYTPYGDGYGQQNPRGGPKRKIFSRDEGEYVEFEEIQVSTEYRQASSKTGDAHTSGYTPREPQVSDAEWEDLLH